MVNIKVLYYQQKPSQYHVPTTAIKTIIIITHLFLQIFLYSKNINYSIELCQLSYVTSVIELFECECF